MTDSLMVLSEINEEQNESRVVRLGGAYTLILFFLVAFFLLLALLFGTMVYGAVNETRDSANDARISLNLLANSIRIGDTMGGVDMQEGPEGNALILTEFTDMGAYETRFYQYQGDIVQEYTKAGNDFDPEEATKVIESDRFDFSLDGSILTVDTDQGSVSVALRNVWGDRYAR